MYQSIVTGSLDPIAPYMDYVKVKPLYSGAHISWHELILAENQGNHQNLVPSMLTYEF